MERRRSQRPATTGFEIEEPEVDDTVVAVVTHPPGLDPFIGLSPARERHTFTGVEVDGGWLVESEPEVELGEVTELLAGPQSTDLIAQYSTDILAWARVMPVTGPVTPFSVVVAPIGDDWRILAVAD